MYTLIFNRETSPEGGQGEFRIHFFKNEKEVHDAIRLLTFEQERLSFERYHYHHDRYYYGDYGFLVLKNEETVYKSSLFDDTFDNCFLPEFTYNENIELSCDVDIKNGVKQHEQFSSLYNKMSIEEKEYSAGLSEYKTQLRKLEVENKERALLKELLEKYPDLKL